MQSTIEKAKVVSVDPACLEPFEKIGLAFSGGGFRAASYALGVLSYLQHISVSDHPTSEGSTTLLSKVTYMSSASGGTITTALYSLYQGLGKSFPEFYVKLHTELYGDTLLKKALTNLVSSNPWKEREHKQRTIINAFALAYDECLFDGCTVGDLLQKSPVLTNHLEEVCFNTTELFRGLLFRQQIALSATVTNTLVFGSYVLNIDTEVAYKLKLGDVLAASACFPGGFEPIMFPNDFAHAGLSMEELKKGLHMHPQTNDKAVEDFISKKTFGFMDGGITDNQGLESLMQADQRRHEEKSFKPFSLMLVNDVASHYLNPYCEPSFNKSSFWNAFTLRGIKFLLACITILSIVGVYILRPHLSHLTEQILFGVCIVIGSFSVLLLAVLLLTQSAFKGSVKPKSSFNLARTFSSGIVTTLLRFLNRTPFRILVHLAKERIRSTMMLTSDLFLKRIRYLLYESFYNTKQWENRGKGNHVYDLSFTNDLNRKQHPSVPPLPDEYNPSKAIQTVAQVAFTMGTTLWFDVNAQNQCHQEASLIACGQFTTCYNLLEYIWRLEHNPNVYNQIPPDFKNRITTIKTQLMNDYMQFKNDPFFLYNELGVQYCLPSFKPVIWTEIHCLGINDAQ